MLYKTDVLTRKADYGRDAVISPRIYSMDQIKLCFECSQKMRSPISIRVDINKYDIKDIADFTKILDGIYPDAIISLMAEGIKNYEDGVKACMAGCNGLCFDPTTPLNDPKAMDEIKKVVKLARALNVSVETYIEDVDKTDVYSLVKESKVDMLRVKFGVVTDDNIKEVKRLVNKIREESFVTVSLGEDTPLDDPFRMKDLVESGCSMLCIYDLFAKACAKAMKVAYDKEPDKKMKALMIYVVWAQNKAFGDTLDTMRSNLNNNLMHSTGKR